MAIYAVRGTGLLLRPLLLGPYDASKSNTRMSSIFLLPNNHTLLHRSMLWEILKRARHYFNFEKCQCFARLLRQNVILQNVALWRKDVVYEKIFKTHIYSSSWYSSSAALCSISVFLQFKSLFGGFCCRIKRYYRIGSSLNWRSATAPSGNRRSREWCRRCCKTKLIMPDTVLRQKFWWLVMDADMCYLFHSHSPVFKIWWLYQFRTILSSIILLSINSEFYILYWIIWKIMYPRPTPSHEYPLYERMNVSSYSTLYSTYVQSSEIAKNCTATNSSPPLFHRPDQTASFRGTPILHNLLALRQKRTQNTHIRGCVINQPRYNMDNWPPIQFAFQLTQNVPNAARKYLC